MKQVGAPRISGFRSAPRLLAIANGSRKRPIDFPFLRFRARCSQLPETLGEAIEVTANSELVLRTLGEHTFRRFIEIKRQEWDEYRVQVTPYEIENFLPVL